MQLNIFALYHHIKEGGGLRSRSVPKNFRNMIWSGPKRFTTDSVVKLFDCVLWFQTSVTVTAIVYASADPKSENGELRYGNLCACLDLFFGPNSDISTDIILCKSTIHVK